LVETVITPPYCGVPKLFHQFPVLVAVAIIVVDAVVTVVETWLVGVVATVVEADVDVVVFAFVVDVVVELPHDDNTKDVTKRKASDNKIIPLFM
jgi:hypothetical protein